MTISLPVHATAAIELDSEAMKEQLQLLRCNVKEKDKENLKMYVTIMLITIYKNFEYI